jgi:glutaredoxin
MKVKMYSRDNCIYCNMARALVERREWELEELKHGVHYTKADLVEALPVIPEIITVPQIWIGGTYIGGYTELATYIDDHSGGYGD